MHVIPFCFLAVEFSLSTFNFYRRHIVLWLILVICYVGVNLLQTFTKKIKDSIYPCVDWHRRPELAGVLVFVFLGLTYIVYIQIVRITNRKLQKSFRLDLTGKPEVTQQIIEMSSVTQVVESPASAQDKSPLKPIDSKLISARS